MSHGVYYCLEDSSLAELWFLVAIRLLCGPYGLITLEKCHSLIDLHIERAIQLLCVGLVIGVLPRAPVADSFDKGVWEETIWTLTAKQHPGHRGADRSAFFSRQEVSLEQNGLRGFAGTRRISPPKSFR